jgi:MoaA/NifB/PqqE/SkfB family radical SAM enzyme
MDPATLETIVRETHAMGTFRVVLGGEGEPSLHPQFDHMLALMTKLGMEPYVLTNGLALDEARARFWATKRAHYRFSIHAGDAETWLRVHPLGRAQQFERLCRVIKILVRAGTARVSTTHVIHRANRHNTPQMVEHARELGVDEILFRPVRAEGSLVQVVLDAEEEKELRKQLTSSLRLAEAYGIRTNLREYLATNLYIGSGVLQTAHLYRRIPCYIGWLYAEFDLDGTMRPCLHSEIAMGRAGEDRVQDIWRSSRYMGFRREALGMPRHGGLVRGCQCASCCMAKYNVNVYNLLHLKSLRYGGA